MRGLSRKTRTCPGAVSPARKRTVPFREWGLVKGRRAEALGPWRAVPASPCTCGPAPLTAEVLVLSAACPELHRLMLPSAATFTCVPVHTSRWLPWKCPCAGWRVEGREKEGLSETGLQKLLSSWAVAARRGYGTGAGVGHTQGCASPLHQGVHSSGLSLSSEQLVNL